MKNVVFGVIYTVIIAGALAYFSGCYTSEAATQPKVINESTAESSEFAETLKETLESAIQEAIASSGKEETEEQQVVDVAADEVTE